ncbi:MAG TPA: hypothetical protein VF384_03765 [Planctomycetota bacterium]
MRLLEVDRAAREQERLLAVVERDLGELAEAEADKKRTEMYAAKREEMVAGSKQRQALQKELDPLVPGPKRESWVWLYENVGAEDASASK